MSPEVVHISLVQLALGMVFILVAGAASIYYSLGLEKDLAVGTVRTFVQLFILGYILKYIFDLDRAWVVILVFGIMILFAAWTIRGRIKEKRIAFFRPILVSMLISYILVSYMVTGVVVGVEPWWKPQYFIPLAGHGHRQFHERNGHCHRTPDFRTEGQTPGSGNAPVPGSRLPGSQPYGGQKRPWAPEWFLPSIR